MAEGKKRNQQKPAESMTDKQLISFAGQLTTELQRRVAGAAPGDPAVCAAIFDVIAAAQKALIANNCPGV